MRKSSLCSSRRIRPGVWLNLSIHEIKTNGITRLPMGAVNVNERITFVKNVLLPGGKNNTVFFPFPQKQHLSLSVKCPPKLIIIRSWELWWPASGGGHAEATMPTEA